MKDNELREEVDILRKRVTNLERALESQGICRRDYADHSRLVESGRLDCIDHAINRNADVVNAILNHLNLEVSTVAPSPSKTVVVEREGK